MRGFETLVQRHQVDPGPLVHVGSAQHREIPTYYGAGFLDITVVDSDPQRVKNVRTRFPGVNVVEMEDLRPGAGIFSAHTVVINAPGHELGILDEALWNNLHMLIVATDIKGSGNAASPYDLLTEAVTTRGFVEVDRWTRVPSDSAGLYVAYLRP